MGKIIKFPEILKEQIIKSLEKVYKDNSKEIFNNILEIINRSINGRPSSLLEEDITRDSEWYKDEIIYMFYADQFGVKDENSKNTFKDLIPMIDYLKELGITLIYILPFMDSPMKDAGFDVRNPYDVRKDLGGLDEFKIFIDKCKEKGIKIKADLILNHLSDECKYFQEALQGDIDKLNYFIYREDIPEYKKYLDERLGIVIDYSEKDGTITKRRQIFPDICENNYRKVRINNKDYYLYHTFYPFQLDLNWRNPLVLYEAINIIKFWANLGIDIFRLDAIPFLIKDKGTIGESLPETHEILKILSAVLQIISTRSVFQAECCQLPKDIRPYFGEEKIIDFGNYKIKRTDEVQIAYHFPLMQGIWGTLISKNKNYFIEAFKKTPLCPGTTSWATFLRVHDELTLEMLEPETRKLIYTNLVNKGKPFREGFGVSGRVANFLDNDPDKILLAYSILFSLPGIPIIYYGDEIGKNNNYEYANQSAKERESSYSIDKSSIKVKSFYDSRDINRGPILLSEFNNAINNKNSFENTIYNGLKRLIRIRKDNKILTRGDFKILQTDNDDCLAYLRTFNNDNLIIVNNLNNIEQEFSIMIEKDIILKNNYDILNEKKIILNKKENKIIVKVKPYQSLWLC